MTAEAVLREARKDLSFYDESGGGVTFSGGEPLAQSEFLLSCLRLLRRDEIHVAVDTSGYCGEADLLRVAEYTDLFLFDIKLIDPEKHEYYTGVNNSIILSNLKKLDKEFSSRGEGKINLRFPLIPGINDYPENIAATADIALSLRNLSAVNVLPYHSIGAEKYKKLSIDYKTQKISLPTAEEVDGVIELFASRGLNVVKGG